MKKMTLFLCVTIALGGVQFAKASKPPTNPATPVNYFTDDPDDFDALGFYGEAPYESSTELRNVTYGQTARWDISETLDGLHEVLGIYNLGTGNWLPIQFASQREIKKYSYFHIDVFCSEATDFRVGFHSNYPVNVEEYFPLIKAEDMTPGQWYSIEYPLDEFLARPTWANANANLLRFGQVFEGDVPTYSNEIYVTNLFVFNGTPTCLKTSGLSNIKPESVKLYIGQNDQLYISSVQKVENLNIYSLSGQKVAAYKQPGNKTDLSALSSGVYIVSVQLADGSVVKEKVIK